MFFDFPFTRRGGSDNGFLFILDIELCTQWPKQCLISFISMNIKVGQKLKYLKPNVVLTLENDKCVDH